MSKPENHHIWPNSPFFPAPKNIVVQNTNNKLIFIIIKVWTWSVVSFSVNCLCIYFLFLSEFVKIILVSVHAPVTSSVEIWLLFLSLFLMSLNHYHFLPLILKTIIKLRSILLCLSYHDSTSTFSPVVSHMLMWIAHPDWCYMLRSRSFCLSRDCFM